MKNKNILWVCLVFILNVFPTSIIYAAAWLQPKGTLLTIATNQAYNACDFWNQQGELQSGPCFFQYAFAPYFEYGALEKFTMIVNPVFNTFNQGSQAVPFGFENIFLAGRYSLFRKDWTELSVQLGYNEPIRTSLFGSSATSTYAIINRMAYLDARILYGTGGPTNKEQTNTWYADSELGFDPNFSGASDELKINFMVGWKTLNGQLVFEVQEWNTIKTSAPISNAYPNYNLFTFMGDITYWFVPGVVGLQVGLQQDLYGTNIGRGTAPVINLWWVYS